MRSWNGEREGLFSHRERLFDIGGDGAVAPICQEEAHLVATRSDDVQMSGHVEAIEGSVPIHVDRALAHRTKARDHPMHRPAGHRAFRREGLAVDSFAAGMDPDTQESGSARDHDAMPAPVRCPRHRERRSVDDGWRVFDVLRVRRSQQLLVLELYVERDLRRDGVAREADS